MLLQMTGGNDISLIYPWVHISSLSQDIGLWLDREEAVKERRTEVKRSSEEIGMVSGCRRLSQGIKMMTLICIQPSQGPRDRVYIYSDEIF